MPIHKELLNGGIVQTRHPTLLRPGELQTAADCILRPGDPALHKAPGRGTYGTVATTSVSCTTNNNTTLQSTGAFGSEVTGVSWPPDGLTLTAALGDFSGVTVGQSVWHANLVAGAYVTRVYDDNVNDLIDISQPASSSGSAQTVTFSDYTIYTRIVGTEIPTDTVIASITDSSTLTMSQAATGNSSTTRTFSEAVRGLRTLVFDQFDDLLIAQAADKLYYSPITATTGTFTSLLTGLTPDPDATLEAIQTKNRHILLNGVDAPRIVRYRTDPSDATAVVPVVRSLGMQPVLAERFSGVGIISGSWSSLTKYQEGWYYFVVTEVLDAGGDDEVESTYIGDPRGVHITDYTTQGVRVTLGAITNDGLNAANTATHWRIYMAKQNAGQFPIPDLSDFTRIATVDIGTTTYDITVDNPYQFGWAQTHADVAGHATLFPDSAIYVLSTQAPQTIACVYSATSTTVTSAALFGNVYPDMEVISSADDFPVGTYVVSKTDSSTITVSQPATNGNSANLVFGSRSSFDNTGDRIPPPGDTTVRKGLFTDFGIQNIGRFMGATITGIEVEIQAAMLNGSGSAACQITVEDIGTAESDPINFTVKGKNYKTYKVGSPDSVWGLSWDSSDFVDSTGTFGVNLSAVVALGILQVDGIKVTIYAGSQDLDADPVPFATVIIADQLGDAFGSGSYGPPPVASTGDLFEGQLILNDVQDEAALVASLPDEEESFPDVYRVSLESKSKDKIRLIRRLNNTLIVGCETSIKRLNYFPTESDADFKRGRAYEDIATNHGIVGRHAAVILDVPSKGSVLAYVSHNGLHYTDGVTTAFLNEDVDWENLFRSANLSRVVLENYPKLSLLALYYEAAGSTNDRKQKALYFSYHPTHIKEGGRLPAVGPVSVEGESAATAILSGVSYLLTGHSTDGTVYLEDQGATSDDGTDITPSFRTRRFWLRDMGYTGRLERILFLTDASGDSSTGGFSVQQYVTEQGLAVAAEGSALTADTSIGELVEVWGDVYADAIDFEVSKSAAQNVAFRCHYYGFEFTPAEQETN